MNKIKWGVLGTAGIADACTIPGMKLAQNCELYAIAGRSMTKAEDFKIKFGFKKAYGNYQDLLDDTAVEAVYIPLPNDLHYEWTKKILQSGKHVLCEKPLAISKNELKELYEVAKENNVYLMEAFAYLHSPYIKALKNEIAGGTIGDITYIESAFITSGYDLSNIRMRRECYGGCTYDLGVYCTSLILSIIGDMPKDIKAVSTFSKENIDTYTSVVMDYENGVKAAFSCGMVLETNKDRRIDRFKIQGTKGTITGGVFEFNLEGEMTYTVELFDGSKEVKTITAPHNYMLEVEQFGKCVSGEEIPYVTEEFSLNNAEMIDRILDAIGY